MYVKLSHKFIYLSTPYSKIYIKILSQKAAFVKASDGFVGCPCQLTIFSSCMRSFVTVSFPSKGVMLCRLIPNVERLCSAAETEG